MSSAAAEGLEDPSSSYPTELKTLIWMWLHVSYNTLHEFTNFHVYHIEEVQLSLAQIHWLPHCESQTENPIRTIQNALCE